MNLKEKKWQRGQHRATSLGSGGSTTSHRIPGAQVGSAPSGGTERGVWKDTRGTRLDETDVMAMVTQIKTTMPAAQQDEFDWGLTDSDQGNSEFKMMAFLWLKSDVSLWYQRHTLAFFVMMK